MLILILIFTVVVVFFIIFIVIIIFIIIFCIIDSFRSIRLKTIGHLATLFRAIWLSSLPSRLVDFVQMQLLRANGFHSVICHWLWHRSECHTFLFLLNRLIKLIVSLLVVLDLLWNSCFCFCLLLKRLGFWWLLFTIYIDKLFWLFQGKLLWDNMEWSCQVML